MSEKKQESFTVTDRRLFTSEGELRREVSEEEVLTSKPVPPVAAEAKAVPIAVAPSALDQSASSPSELDPSAPPPPTAAEQKEQAEAYRQSARELDARVELSGHSAKEMTMTFERFMASLYMTAMMQLGLMHEQGGQPGVDLIGARQTIDTLGMIAEKTKGNLTPKEQGFLQNCLYELRMAYVEVTNTLAHPPQAPGPITGTNG